MTGGPDRPADREATDEQELSAPYTPRIRVLLADDHHLVREALHRVLDAEPWLRVVGEAGARPDVFRLLEAQTPDVLLLDVTFGDSDGIAILRDVSARWPAIRVVMLTMHRDPETVRQALRAGAAGYVAKGAHTSELVDAIRAVARGERYLHSSVAGMVIDDSLRWMEVASPLSAREREILALIATSSTAADVGRELGISAHTVRRHVANMSKKLGLRGSKALIRYALEHGMVRER